MHSSIVLFAAAIASVVASPQASAPLALGAICTSSSQCQTGVECYAVNSMLEPRCGNMGSTCTLDTQCFASSCVSGACGAAASSSTSSASAPATTSIPVGSSCIPGGTACANDAQCYAVNSDANPVCGNFQATCTSDSQCGFNACVSGSCSGPLPSSSSIVTSSAQPTATSTTVAVGGVCIAGSSICAGGSQCYAVNSNLVPHCGNAGASCTLDSQCAFNTCVSGSCSGVLPSSSTNSSRTVSTVGTTSTIGTVAPSGFSTSVTVVAGKTSSVLVNAAGATTSFGSIPTATTASLSTNGAGKVVGGLGGLLAAVLGAGMLL